MKKKSEIHQNQLIYETPSICHVDLYFLGFFVDVITGQINSFQLKKGKGGFKGPTPPGKPCSFSLPSDVMKRSDKSAEASGKWPHISPQL